MPRWQKNEPDAPKRRCLVLVMKSDGSFAPRDTDFVDLGMVFFMGPLAPDYSIAAGALTNQRRELDFDDFTFTADHTTETFTATAHGLETGDGPVELTTSNTLPAGLATSTDYFIIDTGDNTFQLAASLADAYAGTPVAITSNGTGTHTLSTASSCQRGLDGHFVYQATQAETYHDCPESLVIVDGPNYERSQGWGGLTTVEMGGEAAMWDAMGADGFTRGEEMTALFRTDVAKINIVGNDYAVRDVADSKDSHHGTLTASGRIDAGIDDLT